MQAPRDHGGGIDAAAALYGGAREAWIDLSTGINPLPYPLPDLTRDAWTALPDRAAQDALVAAARTFWRVPDTFAILPAPGASSLIARLPALAGPGRVHIPAPTYNEHAAAFAAQDWTVEIDHDAAGVPRPDARVLVHPNNPTGTWWSKDDLDAPLCILDESFADVDPDRSLLGAAHAGTVVLKSFGKFWGLAGLRLGFAIGAPAMIERLEALLGPWAVSGPALEIGHAALTDTDWARQTRERLARDAARLDDLLAVAGADPLGGTSLFRLYHTPNASEFQDRLARHHIWSRIFPYSKNWVRLGLPAPDDWARLEAAL
ncbi:threonine-phosphate decarboxylase CobD [Roseovarius aestuariivivens]|uniref:threonine-phosphate decarboxylase CobD n=1 Tax=Roseovarius aestuariivivens TaxID=1888910 RepID=UPI001081E0E3|nr:threonine-phosphate decarboxylase CobD [Roseovarius aestuariivivens]